MYVCLCYGITETELRREIAAGAASEDDLGARCRAGSACGQCLERIADMLDDAMPDDAMLDDAAGRPRRAGANLGG